MREEKEEEKFAGKESSGDICIHILLPILIDEICIMGLVSHAIYTKSLLSYS
jgi:hypothetical protein